MAIALIVAAVVAPFWYWDGGLIEIEATQFVQNYLADRPVLAHVFDPRRNDINTYQARELSYFADYLDSRIFAWLAGRGTWIFIPASALAASLLSIGVFMRGARRAGTPSLTASLLLLIYFTNYVHLVTTGMLYRSAKPLLVPLVITTTFALAALLRRQRSDDVRDRWAPLLLFLLLCAMSLLDRQGFFMAVVAFGATMYGALWMSTRRDIVFAAAAAVVTMVLYDLALGPWLVERINGYRPSFDYQRIPIAVLVTDVTPWLRAGKLLLSAAATLFGGLPTWAPVLAVVLALGLARGRLSPHTRTLTVLCALVFGGQLAMFAAMVVRHPPIYEYIDHRLWYYPLPFQALLTTVLAIAAAFLRIDAWHPYRRLVLHAVLMAVIVSNVTSWNEHERRQLRSRWFPDVVEQNEALKATIADGRLRWYLTPEYRGFYTFLSRRRGEADARAGAR
ncbi:MAG TPA: hypothetical protein VFV95_06730 [Vicinamibacterales bacterium]|nr:hypothetical protein [Vicinamibacterales bacterium]